ASGTIAGFANGGAVFYTVNFSSPATVTGGTQYGLVVRPNVNPSAGTYALTRGNTDVYAGGAGVSSADSGSTSAAETASAGFKIFIQTVFAPSGTFVSSLKDANPPPFASPNWLTLSWNATTPSNTAIQFQAAASDNSGGPFNFVGPDGTAGTFFN